MPLQALPPLPSFMSVWGDDVNMNSQPTQQQQQQPQSQPIQSIQPAQPFHGSLAPLPLRYTLQPLHRGNHSTSTSATTESNESSPTTTISTADSSSLTEPSPSSSPESPVDVVPLSPFVTRNLSLNSSQDCLHPPPSPLSGLWGSRPVSPNKKARNMKNLSLNMASPPSRPAPEPPRLLLRSASALDTSTSSAPPSPSFVLPPKPQPRKRPSKLGLTIQTPGPPPSLQGDGSKGLRIVPPTPGMQPRILRHHQSSPALSLMSPSLAPRGGMQLPAIDSQPPNLFHRPRQPGPLAIQPVLAPSSGSSDADGAKGLGQLQEDDAEYDAPLSQEVKSPAYPKGPVCIYDPLVFLYLEPNIEEAMQFDVIFNVAREVKNPFTVAREKKDSEPVVSILGQDTVMSEPVAISDDTSVSEPNTACTTATFMTAFENQPTPTTASPTTPKAGPTVSEPEYIHVPWDHNTNIVDDLVNLVTVIDERVRQGKKVLVHCQCGVSRSASLIIAYGVYKNSSLTVQEAYDFVKNRSRWIGPNMNLIYQLSEFRNKLMRKTGQVQPGFRSWRNGGGMMGLTGNGRANTITSGSPTARPSLKIDFDMPRPEPQTAPLPEDRDRTPRTSPLDDKTPHSAQLFPKPSFGDLTMDNALSAPPERPAVSWPPPFSRSTDDDNEPPTPFPAMPAPAPMSTLSQREPQGLDSILSASNSPPSDNIVTQSITVKGMSSSEPPTPGLLSPRTEFMANPFVPSPAASFGFVGSRSLGASSIQTSMLDLDPRSPVQRGEAPIVRSIFDVL
ncbi:MAG: hypothetical protein M1814_006244 [Vezdaea aestivalis]|nr:MAG: hypothetical protein M1814_006244 [Vezdaea aestivalis]